MVEYLVLGNHSAMYENREIYITFKRITNPSQHYLYPDLALKALYLYSLY